MQGLYYFRSHQQKTVKAFRWEFLHGMVNALFPQWSSSEFFSRLDAGECIATALGTFSATRENLEEQPE
jgi:hypothetical protein